MKVLWLIVVGLGLLYLGVWAATENGRGKTPAGPVFTPASSLQSAPVDALVGQAKTDARARLPAGASIELVSATPKTFSGDDLKIVSPTASGATPGFVIVLSAQMSGKETARLTYHARPPETVVFVEQQNF